MVDYWAFVDGVLDRVLADVGLDPIRWKTALDRLHALPPAARARIYDQLESVVASPPDEPVRTELWSQIREVVHKHRQFATAQWALPATEVSRLDVALERIAPVNAAARLAWLFNEETPYIAGVSPADNFAEYDNALGLTRAGAARRIYEQGGWNALLELADKVNSPRELGAAVANAGLEDGAASVDFLASSDARRSELAVGYATRRFVSGGWDWMDLVLSRRPGLRPDQQATLLHCTRDCPRAWVTAESLGPEVDTAFWRQFETHGRGHDFAYAVLVSQRLLGCGRPAAALHMLQLYRAGSAGTRTEVIASALEALVVSPPDPESYLLSRENLEQLFRVLQDDPDFDWARLARLEWSYVPVLDLGARTKTLFRLLAEDPGFLIDIVRQMTGPPAEGDEPTSDQQALAANGYRLLRQWKVPPGLSNEKLDKVAFENWLHTVREGLDGADQVQLADTLAGQTLIGAPPAPDGDWPCDEVGQILEDVQSDAFEQGLRDALMNQRRTSTRGAEDGGQQELELVAYYRSEANRFRNRWPRLAAVMRNVAESYERFARLNESRAERRRQGVGF